MIIQCKQCRTKFRFDDSQMEGDGLWMRCSRCQHVFFQDNPAALKPVAMPDMEPAPETEGRRPSFEPADTPVGVVTPDDDVNRFLSEVMKPQQTADPQVDVVSGSVDHEDLRVADIDFSGDVENAAGGDEATEAANEDALPLPRKKGQAWKAVLWTILIVVVIPAIIILVFFPKVGERYRQMGDRIMTAGLNLIGVSRPVETQSVTALVKLQDIRQRIVNNYILGNLRIVEGTAVNQADFPISRIRVKGEILDAYAVVLGERVSYAGNILTEEELTNMSEEEITKRLELPEGRDNTNEKIIPNGRIPFMIVFTSEPPGSIKTTVMITGAERLL